MSDSLEKQPWIHPTLLLGVVAGSMYFLYQLGDMFSKVQSFEIYTTPPGIGDLLKLLATVVGIVAAACGLNVRDAIANVVSGFTGGGSAKQIWLLPMLLAVGLSFSACASTLRTADGHLNVPLLLEYAQAGITADCQLGMTPLTQQICTIGTDAISTATAAADKNPQAIGAAVKQSLIDSAGVWPVIDPYVRWLINLL